MARLSVYELRLMLVLSLRGDEATREECRRAVGREGYVDEAARALAFHGAVIEDRDKEIFRLLPGRAAELLGLARVPAVQQQMFSEECLLSVNNPVDKSVGGAHTPACAPRTVPNIGDKEISQLQTRDLPAGADGTRLSGRVKAHFEQRATEAAIQIASRYRQDGYLMDKLAVQRRLKEELMAGRTPTARKFAVLYAKEPGTARELIGTAVQRNSPGAALNVMLQEQGVRY
jgi:hypothetical protein